MKRFIVPIIVIALLSTLFAQMLAEAWLDGGSSDEQIHILSGYTTITQAHVLFDPEHPFLAKALSAISLLWVRPTVPYHAANLRPDQALSTYNTYREANQWAYEMVFAAGNNPDQLLFLTRAVIALLTVLLAGTIFWWVKSMWGTASALAALALVSFEPSIIAHGHLSNDDTAATLFFIAALAAFHQFLKSPNRKHIFIAGIVLGLGLITKYSLLLLGPIFIALTLGWLIFEISSPPPSLDLSITRIFQASNFKSLFTRLKQSEWRRFAIGLLSIFLIAWAVIWIAYGSLIIINPDQNPTRIIPIDQFTEPYASIAPFILPVMYEKGAALLFDPNSHGRDGYLMGACYTGGRLDYFTLMAFFKTPLPTLILFGITCYLWFKQRGKHNFVPVIILVSLIVYLAISSLSKINIGYRHILPVGTLILIAAAYPFSQVNWHKSLQELKLFTRTNFRRLRALSFTTNSTHRPPNSNSQTPTSLYPLLLLILLAASVISGALSFPNHLSYYNLLTGEPRNRPFISADSNVDWGQGTKALHRYMQQHGIHHVVLDNFTGTAEAESRGYNITPANPQDHQYRGYIALSRSTIIDHYCTKQNDWGWLVDNHDPIAIIGGSINLYKR